VSRDSATRNATCSALGDDAAGSAITATLDRWQRAGDERMWKVIISPEFGEQMDLDRLTLELMGRMEYELGAGELEWAAVKHYNTEHPHVHIGLRGVGADGRSVRFDRDFIKRGLRALAEELCTKQLGYRTELDAARAESKEVNQYRYTSLDRAIKRSAITQESAPTTEFLRVPVGRANSRLDKSGSKEHERNLVQRLLVLHRMGLAQTDDGEWSVRADFEAVLRSMQRIGDQQKTLAAHGVAVSDPRLPIESADSQQWKVLEGRVLVHGEEEDGSTAGRCYFMIEGTDARVHHVLYTPEIEEARHRGELRAGSFVRMRRYRIEGVTSLDVHDLGDAEEILRNGHQLRTTARKLIRRGVVPEEHGWGGWLGRYEAALRTAALELNTAKARLTALDSEQERVR
jgi:hypothetical protein